MDFLLQARNSILSMAELSMDDEQDEPEAAVDPEWPQSMLEVGVVTYEQPRQSPPSWTEMTTETDSQPSAPPEPVELDASPEPGRDSARRLSLWNSMHRLSGPFL